jgi:hypothetical protein
MFRIQNSTLRKVGAFKCAREGFAILESVRGEENFSNKGKIMLRILKNGKRGKKTKRNTL